MSGRFSESSLTNRNGKQQGGNCAVLGIRLVIPLLLSASFFMDASAACAKVITFISEYIYHAGQADGKIGKRGTALEQVKRFLLEKFWGAI
jgi:hypothetical protein